MRELSGVEQFCVLNGVITTQAHTLKCTFKSVHFKNIIYNLIEFFKKLVYIFSLKGSSPAIGP